MNLSNFDASRKSMFSHLPERISGLAELAENMWWSWHFQARMLFKNLDRRLWKQSGHNPDLLVRQISVEALEKSVASQNWEEVVV